MSAKIVVVIPTFSQTIEQRICEGIYNVLSPEDVDLTFVPAGYIPRESQWTVASEQVHHDIVALEPDVVILSSGGLGYKTNTELYKRFLAIYEGIPQIHLSTIEPHYPSITVDNYIGMKNLITEIYQQRLPKKVVFIAGPTLNIEANLRLQAVEDVIAELNCADIPFTILPGDFTAQAAQKSLDDYLRAGNTAPDLIIASNDLSAKGALECLEAFGIACPEQCWVTGFDDFEYAQFMQPSLSTVHYPAQRLGEKAGAFALSILDGGLNDLPKHTGIAAEPRFRTSTGHAFTPEPGLRDRLNDLWSFIKERDVTSRKFEVIQAMHAHDDIQKVLNDVSADLDELHIGEMSAHCRTLSGNKELCVYQKPACKFTQSHRRYQIMAPLEADHNNYGYMLAEAHPLSSELIEFFAPQLAEIQHRNVIRQRNEQLRNQNELSERMASLGRLVAGVAHEANTPIGSGKLAASSLIDDVLNLKQKLANNAMTRTDFDRFLSETEEHAKLIYNNLDRAASLISNFKMVSVDQSSEQQREIELSEYIEAIVSSLNYNFKNTMIKIITDFQTRINVTTYPGAIAQLVTNLLLNAKLHGFDEGKEPGEIKITLAPDDMGFRLTVADNGCGIDEPSQANIFEPFFTTARTKGGSGLGLYIVFNIADQKLNWDLSVESAPGEGFSISFTPKAKLLA